MGEFESRSVKTRDAVEDYHMLKNSQVFTDLLLNSPNRSPRFSPGYGGTVNMFYFFYKIIIIDLRKRNIYNIQRAFV